MKLALVEWNDSSVLHGWEARDWFDGEVLKCQSVGFLLKETSDSVVLLLSRSSGDKWAEGITIPKCSIKRMRQLQVVKQGNCD